ncbi:DNA polymerase type-X family protein pol4 [Colletotrichum truncatum]|uniref:DNA polymerase type-X family protein pol4 n=1 Tax=Colletotrichum truncatum TaxID=5467 RepID=A0ACC3YMR7_COLTU|nr:DNA polymerase type-X family protein pol4 [Colletotrichum truncatum]KAF6791631.1 DNA polymerase type-X family protein pol4 [Colletotrichum truncatum]
MATGLDFPPMFLLPTHLSPDRLHELEEKIPNLTFDIHEAVIILGNIFKKERALFELRHMKVHTEPVGTTNTESQVPISQKTQWSTLMSDSDSSVYTQDGDRKEPSRLRSPRLLSGPSKPNDPHIIKVVNLAWLIESLEAGEILPLHHYLIYEGRKKDTHQKPTVIKGSDILTRAAVDASIQAQQSTEPRPRMAISSVNAYRTVPSLTRQTTSEHESALELPLIPSYLRTTYACQRATPADPLNAAFVEELKKIRTVRKLTGDQIGVRAYSTSIATISAYPHVITNPQEVARLPGCGGKIAELWHEWKEIGTLHEADDSLADPKLSVMHLFYGVWGVGDATARHFYQKGWRDLDDVVEYGWDSLTRVQQIGVKFYDDFKLKIPRHEVESIANIILSHAQRFSPDFQMVIAGGYRRGKKGSGDVDVIISHPDESATLNFVGKLILSLEKSKYITHTLTLSNHNSERGQQPVSWKGNDSKGSGFDTLDKALVVWQQPGTSDQCESTGSKSTVQASQRPHRRVDIILSPWKTVGCALLGWSGDTTFQRDLRRYCKKQKNLKFDSSGIRNRLDGCWVDFEGNGKASDMLTAEKRVFEGLGLDWIPPEDRCTG